MNPALSAEVNVTRRLIDNILDSVIRGLDEADMPLTDEQRAFLASAGSSLTP